MKNLTSILTLVLISFGYTTFSQCPTTSPSDFNVTDGGSIGCTSDTWKHEQGVTYGESGNCLILAGTTCDLSWHTVRYDLNCSFCAEFTFTLSTLTSDGIAFSMVDNTNKGSAFPCSTPYGCAEGGNLGYNNLTNTNTSNGGALTVEIDVFNNSTDGDADPSCDHVSIVEDGNNNTFVQQACLPNMDDGNPHTFRMCWNASTNQLTITIDGTTYITLNQDIRNYFDDDSVNFAFSSGYNGSFAGQNQVCSFNIGPNALDAENLNFNAHQKNKTVELMWHNSENISAKYELLKSKDGIYYESLTSLFSIENRLNYVYVDKLPFKGTNYYKIKEELLHSGKITESSPTVVTFKENNITIYAYKKQLSLTLDEKVEYTLKVMGIMGNTVFEETYKGKTLLDLSFLDNGIYIVNVITENEVSSEKIYIAE
ncbi:MAG: hypothetical protein ACLGGV_03230 [Bacteroidia bacterium]